MSRRGLYLQLRSPDLLRAAKSSASTTYGQLALRTGCSPAFLCDLATGKSVRIDTARAVAIEDALGVERGHLFHLAPADYDLLAPYIAATHPDHPALPDATPAPLPGVAVIAA